MPKLSEKQQQVTEQAEGGFRLVDDGAYLCKLTKVEQVPGPTDDQWALSWEISDPDFEEYAGVSLRDWISLGEKSAWKMRQFFDALGFTLDSDTDEMVGETARLYVVKVTQEQGKLAGQKVNRVTKYADPSEDVD
jgi:hypothetical protein